MHECKELCCCVSNISSSCTGALTYEGHHPERSVAAPPQGGVSAGDDAGLAGAAGGSECTERGIVSALSSVRTVSYSDDGFKYALKMIDQTVSINLQALHAFM